MPPPTSSLKPNAKPVPPGKKSPTPTINGSGASIEPTRVSKPDQAAYNAEQEEINKEIAAIKTRLDAVRSRISLSQSPSSNDRRSVIKAEMDSLRGDQGRFKAERQKTFDEMKRLQEGVQKKIKEAQGQRGKVGFKSVADIDERIASLDKQIESGSMKLIDEKKALAEMSNLRRSRKTLESSGTVDEAIAADRTRIDELKKVLDDPESKKVSERFDQLKSEMDGLREEGNKTYEERNKLFDERNDYSAKMDELYGRKRDSAQKHREDNDNYYAKVSADRQARQERFKAEKAKEEAARREEDITRMREEAKIPAFSKEIEDCSVLVGWFKGKYGGGEVPPTHAGGQAATAQLQGVRDLDIRKVEGDFAGMTLKKKGEDEEMSLFGGGGKKKKGGKKPSASGAGTSTEGGSGSVNLPMSLLSALLSLGIPPPSGKEDVQRVVVDLETKKNWYEANSETKTKAEIERVEKAVAKMQKKNAILTEDADDGAAADALEDADETVVNGAKEPTHTVAIAGEATGIDIVEEDGSQLPKDASPSSEVKHVDSALEEIKEAEEE